MTRILDEFQSPKILTAEQKCLEVSFAGLRGYYLLMLGRHRFLRDLPRHSLHNFVLAPEKPIENTCSYIQSDYSALALRNNSVDAVIVPYLLEFCPSPKETLEEIFRVLIGEGKLYLFCFQRYHPWSWFYAPKAPNKLSLLSVRQLLIEAGFSVVYQHSFYYGALVFIEAQKHIRRVTPIRELWQRLPSEGEKVFASPVTNQSR